MAMRPLREPSAVAGTLDDAARIAAVADGMSSLGGDLGSGVLTGPMVEAVVDVDERVEKII
jgi:hypothetical protein